MLQMEGCVLALCSSLMGLLSWFAWLSETQDQALLGAAECEKKDTLILVMARPLPTLLST